jgi:hypothetical protein
VEAIERLEAQIFVSSGQRNSFKSRYTSNTNIQHECLLNSKGIVLRDQFPYVEVLVGSQRER